MPTSRSHVRAINTRCAAPYSAGSTQHPPHACTRLLIPAGNTLGWLAVLDVAGLLLLLLQMTPPGLPMSWQAFMDRWDASLPASFWFVPLVLATLFPVVGLLGAYFVQRWALWLYTGFLVACVGPRPALAPRRRPPYPRRPVRAVTGRHRRTPSPSSPLARIPSLRSSPPHSAGFRVCMLFEMSAQVVPRIDIRGISPGESHSLLDPQDLPWISPAELAGAHCR